MDIIKAYILGQQINIEKVFDIISGNVGQYAVSFVFSPEWDEYTKFVIFSNGFAKIETQIEENEAVVIPKEVLRMPGQLSIGVYGINDENVRSTVWSKKLTIQRGVI